MKESALQSSNVRQPASQDAWDERPIHSSSKMGYSIPENDSQNEDDPDHEPAPSNIKNPQSDSSKLQNSAKANFTYTNVNPGKQSATLNKNSGTRSADNSKTRQPVLQDVWDERPIHSSSKTGYSIPNDDSQNEDDPDHDPVANNNQYHNASNMKNNPANPRNKKYTTK